MAVLSLTRLPILIHDSFLSNNADDLTRQSFIHWYNHFSNKQIFIFLNQFCGKDNEEIWTAPNCADSTKRATGRKNKNLRRLAQQKRHHSSL